MFKKNFFVATMVLALVLATLPMVVSAETDAPVIGGDQGIYWVNCNVDGATIYFDGEDKGITQSGGLPVVVYLTGTPYKTITVEKEGYQPYSAQIPAPGKSVDIGVVLKPASPTIGGDQGIYWVNCNVDGAKVYFDGEDKGITQSGGLPVVVYLTGTPYKTITVEKEGYQPYSGAVPAPGKSVDIEVTLTLTGPVIGGDTGWYVVNCNVEGATVFFDGTEKGVISDGKLKVQVYTTGTPYKTYSVQKAGYTPFSGTISDYPAAGETVNLFATLNPVPTTEPTKSPLSPFGVFAALGLAGLGAVFALKRE